jgi:HEPN domain-containing protein
MSVSDNRYQAERWLATAEEDLRAVRALLDAGLYSHACFQAQQAAEKAVQALWHALGADPWGHSIQRLIRDLPASEPLPELQSRLRDAAVLDRFHIATRYPNGLPDLTPGQVYYREDAEMAQELAQGFVAAARLWLGALGRAEGG